MSELEHLYETRRTTPSDINEHMHTLRRFASQSRWAVEFGVRSGNSTIALLAGLSDANALCTLHSYDIEKPQFEPPSLDRCAWNFTRADTAKLDDIPVCDLLFIDTLHTAAQVTAELRHVARVRKWIIFHDTVLFGCRDEGTDAPRGICHAIWEFLASLEGRSWRPLLHHPNNCGLLVLERFAQ